MPGVGGLCSGNGFSSLLSEVGGLCFGGGLSPLGGLCSCLGDSWWSASEAVLRITTPRSNTRQYLVVVIFGVWMVQNNKTLGLL